MWSKNQTATSLWSDFNTFVWYAQACCFALILTLVVALASTFKAPFVLYHYCLILAIGITTTVIVLLLRITICFKIFAVIAGESVATAVNIGKNAMGIIDATVAKYYPKESEKKD